MCVSESDIGEGRGRDEGVFRKCVCVVVVVVLLLPQHHPSSVAQLTGTDHSIRAFNNDDNNNIDRASVINVNKITRRRREQENSSSN